MKVSELIAKLEEIKDAEGDNLVLIDVDGIGNYLEIEDIAGIWSLNDRSRYDGSAPVCYIYAERLS